MKLLFLLSLLAGASSPAFAVGSDACGTQGWCQCPGGVAAGRCLGSYRTCEEACGLTSGGSAPALPAAGAGFTPQQQMAVQMGQLGGQMVGQALHEMLFGDPQAAAAQRARAAALAEQSRQAALEKKRDDEATKDRLLGEMIGVDAASDGQTAAQQPDDGSFRLLADDDAGKKDPRLHDPRFKSPSFSKGYDAALRCSTQNVGSACADVSGEQSASCINDYKAGYELGRKEQAAVLQRATAKGAGAALSGLPDNAASDPDSGGDCRTQWVEAYHRGYFQSKPR